MQKHLLLNATAFLLSPITWLLAGLIVFWTLQGVIQARLKKCTATSLEYYIKRYEEITSFGIGFWTFVFGLDGYRKAQEKAFLSRIAWSIIRDFRTLIQNGKCDRAHILGIRRFVRYGMSDFENKDSFSLCLTDALSQTLSARDFDWEKVVDFLRKASEMQYATLNDIFDFGKIIQDTMANRANSELDDVVSSAADMYNVRIYEAHLSTLQPSAGSESCSLDEVEFMISKMLPEGDIYDFANAKFEAFGDGLEKEGSLAQSFAERFAESKKEYNMI